MFVGLIYLLTLVLDPLIFALNFTPLLNGAWNILSRLITWLIVIDMVLLLATGIPKDNIDIQGEDDDEEDTV